MRLWKVFKKDFKSNCGHIRWEVDKWQHQNGEILLCENGFHASEKIIDAMKYTNAEIIARVEVKGKSAKDTDKQVWSDMRIKYWYQWDKEDSVRLAIFCAELVLDIFEEKYPKDNRSRKAIEAVSSWLKNPSEEKRLIAAAASAADAVYATRAAGTAASAAAAVDAARAAAVVDAARAAVDAAHTADAARAARAAVANMDKRNDVLNKAERFIKKQLKQKSKAN